jgi:hypothetical protein
MYVIKNHSLYLSAFTYGGIPVFTNNLQHARIYKRKSDASCSMSYHRLKEHYDIQKVELHEV